MMADSRQTPPKVGDGSDEEYQYKRLILEQACYYCQHNIIQRKYRIHSEFLILKGVVLTFGWFATHTSLVW